MFAANLDYLLFASLAAGGFATLHRLMRARCRLLRPGTWLLLAVLLILGWWPVEHAGQQERQRIEEMVGGMAPTYAETLETMGHAKIGLETAPDDPAYLAMIETEKRWQKANPVAHDIYTMRKLPDGQNVFIVDSETDYNRNGVYDGEAEQRTAIGEVYSEKDAGLERAFQGEANFDEKPITDRWGTWVSDWVPLHDARGKVEAVLGVDYSAEAWLRGIANARRAVLARLAVLLVVLASSALVNGTLRSDLAQIQRAKEDLRRSKNRLALRAQQSPLAVIEWDLDLRVTDWNPSAEKVFGFTRAQALGVALLEEIAPDSIRAEIQALLTGVPLEKNAAIHFDEKVTTNGRVLTCSWFNAPLIDDGRIIGVTSLCEDITKRRQLEEQLRQAQKMEAFGQLAGGIAHDFNNLLCVIQGYTDILRQRKDLPREVVTDLTQVVTSSERAADLTRQLLTFSRRQVFQPKNQHLSDTVGEMMKMLRRVLGEDICLVTHFEPAVPNVLADTGMIEQVLLNLAVNARDAMPNGGRLDICLSRRELSEGEIAGPLQIAPGVAICLEIADTGCGIPPENLSRIFDPFFTTKEVGRGTGLGLATVYGIVEQHQGALTVESRLHSGTTFRIFLPAAAVSDPSASPAPAESPEELGGHETILVVEDEKPVRDFVTRLLKSNGYEVFTASSGSEALQVWTQHQQHIHMLFTDMIMPGGLSGADLARRLQHDNHDLKVIYTSGYSLDFVSRKLALLPSVNFLQKPYPPHQLVRTVRENFDAPAAESAV